MATAWSIGGLNSSKYYTHTLNVNVIGQDVAANTTTVSWAYVVTFNNSYAYGGWTNLHNVTFHAYINGVDHVGTPNFDFRHAPRSIAMLSGTDTVTNGSDGSLNLSLRITSSNLPGATNYTAVDFSGPSMPVPTIPRASTFKLEPSSVYADNTVTGTITRANSSFKHDVVVTVDGTPTTLATGVDTSFTYTPASSVLSGAPRKTVTITVTTKSGSTVIGSPVSHDLIVLAPPTYPAIGVGTPYDVRLRRIEVVGGALVPKEEIPFTEVTFTDTLAASGSLTLNTTDLIYSTNLDEQVVVLDVFDGAQWLNVGLLFVLTRAEDDTTDLSKTVTYTGMSYFDYLLSKVVVTDDYQWPTVTPGDVLSQYVAIGKNRGWGPFVSTDFSATLTTPGTAWQNTTAPNVSKKTPVSQLLDGFVSDVLAEYSSSFDQTLGKVVFHGFNPGYGVDWASDGANPIVNLGTAALFKVAAKAPVRKDFSNKLTRVNVYGDETGVTRESAAAVNPVFGHLEGTVDATGVTDAAQLSALGDATLRTNATATVERTFSYDLSSNNTAPSLLPYRTFRPGDWVLAPGDSGPERVRVSQVAITRNEEGTTATITVGDLIPSGVVATARKLAQTGGGAIGGGTLLSPLPLSAAIPEAPVVETAVSAGYWDPTGAAKSGVDITWAPVISSMAGTSITVDLYEVWTREQIGTPWSLALVSEDTDVTVAPLDVQKSVDFRIRARSNAGVYGDYSDVLTVTTLAPATDIPGPDLADLYTDGVGTLYAVWGGTLDSDPAPVWLGYVVAEVSSDAGITWQQMGTPITAAGSIVINPGGYGDYSVRLRGYDRLGNPGAASDPQDITLTDPRINAPLPTAPTGITSTPGASWNASGILPTAWFDLAWDVPTLDVDGNDVSIAGYDIYGLKAGETIQRYLTTSATNSVRWEVANGETWTFQVKAVSSLGGVSDFSDAITDTADAAISVAAAPTPPTLDQYAGILQIKWAGGGMLPQIKSVYASISQSPTGVFTRVGMPLLGAGEVVVPGLAPGDYYAKITMVDELGNASTSAASSMITLLPITGVTIQTSDLPNTGIKMTTGALTAYNASGDPTFILNAATGEVWIAPYAAVIDLGATGTVATTGADTNGIAISADGSDFNTFIHPSGVQIRRDQTALSWWEADATDASLVNFFSPRAVISQRLLVGDYEDKVELSTTGTRLVTRYKGL